ncbi:hypothetical protein [Streptomyces sp. NPDC005077]|uniref:hypothetical protein n=1 Tax=Streptomyces sp. NPDC005077 TaxID=3154292 RepID=UPI00339F4B8E
MELDDRYNLIANVLAQHARDNGLETRLSDRELRGECAVWWPQGFERLDSNAFRTYLEEMVGLGVLAPNHDGRGWHLRGPNALRMIGTAQEIEALLDGAERDCRLEDAVVLESRPLLSDGSSAPLTISQIDYLLGNRVNQVRIVLGTTATGIREVERTLRDAAGQVEGWTVPPIGTANAFRRELTAGRAGEQRLLISDLALNTAKPCRESLALAQSVLPEAKEKVRSVVLISGAAQLDFWQELVADEESGQSPGGETVVVLRRYDPRSLKDWTQRHRLCETDERLNRLIAITGGWPFLLERARTLHQRYRDQDRALSELAQWLGQKSGAEEFVEAVGLLDNDKARTGYFAIVRTLDTGWNRKQDCRAAVVLADLTPDEARRALASLEMLQALERDGNRLRVEPVLHAALGVLGTEG